MLDQRVQGQLGRKLRTTYADIPKGGIPAPIWRLLLDLEQAIAPRGKTAQG
jgi:hypothetical protein